MTDIAPTASATIAGITIRPLTGGDLETVIAIDRALSGRSRRGFFTRRLTHAAQDPLGFVALAAERDGRLIGFVLARLYEEEFGTTSREATLDAIGVDPALARQHGIGRALIDHLVVALRARGIGELATQVDWMEVDLLGFFARSGFVLATRLVLSRPSGARLPAATPVARLPRADHDTDYSAADSDYSQSLAHDRLPVRSMARADLTAIIEIDRRITGRSRAAYLARKLEEAFTESAVRMSLVAEIDGHPAGFLMARVDDGEFGHPEREAVLDTIGVDPRHGHHGVATALLSQLMTNLTALRIESLRTEAHWNQFGLLSFLDRRGFAPLHRLAIRRPLRH